MSENKICPATSKELPSTLAGFQLVCSCGTALQHVREGDLLRGGECSQWAVVGGAVGKPIGEDGCFGGFRVYRRIPVPRQEGMTAPTATVHHSDPAPRVCEVAKPAIKLPTTPAERKGIPIATGFVDYFPDAVAEVARVSKAGNDQHNPGQPLHWDKSKSTDHADCLMRHFVDRGTRDTDGQRHSAKVAWRALALLQVEIESERAGGAK